MAVSKQRQHRHQVRLKQHRQRVAVKKASQAPPPDPYKPAVQAAVRAKYGPQRQEIGGQIRGSVQQDRNIGNWYGQYEAAVEQARQRTQAGYTDAATRIGQVADTSQATDRTNRQEMIARMQTDAASRGATVDPRLEAIGAQAEAARRTGLDEAQAATSRTGASQNAYLADVGRIGVGREVQAHTGESNRRRSLVLERKALKLQAADYGQQVRDDLQQQDFNRQVAEQGLGIKLRSADTAAKTQQSLAQDRKAKNRLQRRGQNVTKRGQDISAEQRAADREARRQAAANKKKADAKKPSKKAELQGSHKIKSQIIDARAEYERQLHKGTPRPQIAADARENKVSEYVLVAAADLANFGYITPGHLRNLRIAGVTNIPKAWKSNRKIKHGVKGGTSSVVGAVRGAL